jgi:hypothetical protein
VVFLLQGEKAIALNPTGDNKMKVIATEGLTAGAHTATISEIALFSGLKYKSDERAPLFRITWTAEAGKTSQLVSIQVEEGNVKINAASKLGKLISACGIKFDAESEIEFGSTTIDELFETGYDLINAPDLSEMKEEGFRPLNLTYFNVGGVSLLKSNAIINVIDNGKAMQIDTVIPALKVSKASKQLKKPLADSEENNLPF